MGASHRQQTKNFLPIQISIIVGHIPLKALPSQQRFLHF
jgi:hypothetical protein